MKEPRNNRLIIFLQFALCAVLAAFCLSVKYRADTRAAQAGAFGFSDKANDTFSHLAYRLYDEVSND